MAKLETSSSRAPRGTKPVTMAFFAALDAAPEPQRTAIARAAQVMIRDELKLRRDRSKAAAVKARTALKGHPSSKAAAKPTARSAAASSLAVPAAKAKPTPSKAPKQTPAASEAEAAPPVKTLGGKKRAPKPVAA